MIVSHATYNVIKVSCCLSGNVEGCVLIAEINIQFVGKYFVS